MVRAVQTNDIPTILEIYNHYIATSTVTFEETLLTLDEVETRIAGIQQKYPYLVYEENGEVIGYAYASVFRTRIAYRFSVETSVYVHKDHYKKGVAKQLYKELLIQLKDQGITSAMGGITLPNEASVLLHEKMGFKKVGHFEKVGYKFDQWLDVGFWQIMLNDPEN